MTHDKNRSIASVALWAVAVLALALGSLAPARADTMPSLFNGLVFAHDMEKAWPDSTTGPYIGGLHGTPTAQVYKGPVSDPFYFTDQPSTLPFSRQHLQTPPLVDTNNPRAYFDTNTRLLAPTSELSFSIFYNIAADAAQNTSAKRFLTTFSGGGSIDDDQFIFDATSSAGTSHTVRMITNNETKTWAGAVTRDGNWHHIGFVFDNGAAQLYVNGQPEGDPESFGFTTVAIQTKNWMLLEEHNHNEFFMSSSFDEAGLWYRALSDAEMLFLYQSGLAAIPEPSSLLLLAMAALALACRPGRGRK